MAQNDTNKEKEDTKLFEEIIKIINDNRVLKKKVLDCLHQSKARYQIVNKGQLSTEAPAPANKKAS